MAVHLLAIMPTNASRFERETHTHNTHALTCTLAQSLLCLMQEVNITAICLAITRVADNRCEELLSDAEATSKKFKEAFLKFSSCHQVYSSRVHLDDDSLLQLGEKRLCTT